ncbi:CGNR zinc finger domain-containing protein [Actinomadura graeca]|uniref:CGNR zinc finger domain-containing protein n=1 Tax=Actinomadura graeca TaxID=2750812 RepID=A0ABX8R278_9ACTN|nr:CGNR zinc finger domain-containing protein [Actinomadura graeca]QXJ24988.1 CGNR zinc finger domain-containing protein [Actinomadura graeca]
MAEARPGEGAAALLRDFVNTLDVDSGTDGLATPARLAEWLAGHGLIPSGAAAGESDLAGAITLREGLRAAMLAHHGPPVPAPDSLPPGSPAPDGGGPADGLDGALAALPLRIGLTGPRPALVPLGPPGTAATALARLAAAIMEASADGTWTRLKVCQEDTCRWAFFDTSKNRSRAWCSMRVCGNRTKTRAYRARRRPPSGAEPGTGAAPPR